MVNPRLSKTVISLFKNLRPRQSISIRSEPETLRFKNPSARLLQCSVALCFVVKLLTFRHPVFVLLLRDSGT